MAQGIDETRKALDELRQYCRSPDCNAWKTMSRLSSPVQSVSVCCFSSYSISAVLVVILDTLIFYFIFVYITIIFVQS